MKKKKTSKVKQEVGIVLRIKETRVLGNEYETKILRVCSENRYPFVFKDGRVGHAIPDFINRERMRIIEIHNPERSDEEVYARMKAFHIHKHKVTQLTKHNLSRPDWKEFCAGVIKGILEL